MIKTVTLVDNYSPEQLVQIGQSSSALFSVAKYDKENNQFTKEYLPFRCKDYFNELVISRHINKVLPRIYGFKGKEPWKGTPYITVSFDDPLEYAGLLKNFKHITSMEKEVLLLLDSRNRSKLYTSSQNDTFIIKLSKVWVASPVLISFITLAIRSAAYVNSIDNSSEFKNIDQIFSVIIESDESSDSNMLRSITQQKFNYKLFLREHKRILGDNPLTGWDDKHFKDNFKEINDFLSITFPNGSRWNVGVSHDYSGIYTFANYINANQDITYVNTGKTWIKTYRGIAG